MEYTDDHYRFPAYFESLKVEVHQCSGSAKTGGPHLEVHSPPQRKSFYQLSKHELLLYNGSLSNWFDDFTGLQAKFSAQELCWRAHEGKSLCSGKREDSPPLIISLPVLLLLETPDDPNPSKSCHVPSWDFPPTLTPSAVTKRQAGHKGMIYDLVGLAFFSSTQSHYIARYATDNNSKIYTYDGMRNGGYAVLEENAKFSTYIAGQAHLNIPRSYTPSAAIYRLRGGADAQDALFKIRTRTCSKAFNLKFSTTNLSTLPDVSYCGNDFPVEFSHEQRFWAKSPQTRGLKEYSSKNPSESKPHRTSQSLAASERQPDSSIPDEPESEEEMLPCAKGILGDSPGPSTPESLPDSLFDVKCRCGLEGNGNIYYNEEEGQAVQCNDCMWWSHMACQTNGRASKLRPKEHFFCDFCSVSVAKAGYLDKYCIAERRYEVHSCLLYKINNQLELAGSWSRARVAKNNSRIVLCM